MKHEELLNNLRNCHECYCDGCKYESLLEPGNFVKCMNALIAEAADAIEELQKAHDAVNDAHNEGYDVGYWAGRRDYEPKWIPVTDRLPEPNAVDERGFAKAYLVKTDRHVMMHTARYNGDWWVIWGRTEVIADNVTHWMPLPQPPRRKHEL